MQNAKCIIQKLFLGIVVMISFLLMGTQTFAHVTVTPKEVGVGQRLNYIVSVPTEEAVPTTSLRLVLPEGLQSVRPNVKVGWTINLVKVGEGENAKITEIVWSGGQIPAEQRDEFMFSAQAPANEGQLIWKAYQTYANGTVVAWDADPKTVEEYSKNNPSGGHDDHSAPMPYSVTKVVNDLAQPVANGSSESMEKSMDPDPGDSLVLAITLIALVLSGVALFMQFRAKRK